MSRRRRKQQDESSRLNNQTYWYYYRRLKELAISMFDWKELPSTIDVRFLELTLFDKSRVALFKDDVLEKFLCLPITLNGEYDHYNNPMSYTAYAVNGYNCELNQNNSVIVYNNYLRGGCSQDIEMFARRLYNLDRIIDINANAQKTPYVLCAPESQYLSILNFYASLENNEPVIKIDKTFDMNMLKTLPTTAPYVGSQLYDLKTQIWNEALTYLGISNVSFQKRERLITDEVTRNQGGTIASRYSRLEMRREGCRQFNEMFGFNISVDYREDFQQVVDEISGEVLGNDTTGGGDSE